jgi:flavorubredoxin
MATVLYDDGTHKCVAFTLLSQDEGVQSNQFLIIDNGEGMILDPGGSQAYRDMLADMSNYVAPGKLRYVFASHEDPDIIGSANGWLLISDAKLLIAQEWVRFLPYVCAKGLTADRLAAIPAKGMSVPLGKIKLHLLPAHYLHSVGNFQVYDPVSKILFSGDMGANLVSGEAAGQPVADFDAHLRNAGMEVFHRRYMSGRRACQLWAQMVRKLDVEWMVPQHGASFKGKEMVNRFLDWIETLGCGVDILTEDDFPVPA